MAIHPPDAVTRFYHYDIVRLVLWVRQSYLTSFILS